MFVVSFNVSGCELLLTEAKRRAVSSRYMDVTNVIRYMLASLYIRPTLLSAIKCGCQISVTKWAVTYPRWSRSTPLGNPHSCLRRLWLLTQGLYDDITRGAALGWCMYLAEAPTCALYHQSHSIVTVTIRFRPIYVRESVPEPLAHRGQNGWFARNWQWKDPFLRPESWFTALVMPRRAIRRYITVT